MNIGEGYSGRRRRTSTGSFGKILLMVKGHGKREPLSFVLRKRMHPKKPYILYIGWTRRDGTSGNDIYIFDRQKPDTLREIFICYGETAAKLIRKDKIKSVDLLVIEIGRIWCGKESIKAVNGFGFIRKPLKIFWRKINGKCRIKMVLFHIVIHTTSL